MQRRTWLTPVALTVALASAAHAQGPRLTAALDSGTIARLTWRAAGREQVQLLQRLDATSDSVRYCRAPSSGCGPGSVNPVRTRSTTALERVELRHGNHARQGALWGAAVGAMIGAFGVAIQGISDSPVSASRKVGAFAIPFAFCTGVGALIGTSGHDWTPAP
jgi:hypothetical protein